MVDLRAQFAAIEAEVRAALDEVLASQQFVLGPQLEAFEREMAQYCGRRDGVGVASGTDALLLGLRACGVEPGRRSGRARVHLCGHGGRGERARGAPRLRRYRAGNAQSFRRVRRLTHHASHAGHRGRPFLRPGGADRTAARAGRAIPPAADRRQRAVPRRHLRRAQARLFRHARRDQLLSQQESRRLWRRGNDPHRFGRAGGAPARSCAITARPSPASAPSPAGTAASTSCRRPSCESSCATSIAGYRSAAALAAIYNERFAANRRNAHAASARRVRAQLLPLHRAYPQRRKGPAERRDRVARHLAERGIASAVFYPIPLHLQPLYASLGGRPGDLPVAERAAHEVLSLPLYPEMTAAQVDRVAGAVSRRWELKRRPASWHTTNDAVTDDSWI